MSPAPAVLLAWGANTFGQCCTDNEGSKVEKRPRCMNGSICRSVSIATPIVAVASGEAHTLLLTGYGDVLACGRAREGQLGLSSPLDASATCQPTVVESLRPWRIVQIACGSKHSVAVSSGGQAFEWGLLLPLSRRPSDGADWKSKRCGLGKDFQAGLNDWERRMVNESWSSYLNNSCTGQSGDTAATGGDSGSPTLDALADTDCNRFAVHAPRACKGLEDVQVQAVACGFAHSVVAAGGGALLAAGYNDKGQLGNGVRSPSASFGAVCLPPGNSAAATREGISLLACGLNHTVAVTEPGGELFAWGLGVFGQLGLGHEKKENCWPEAVGLKDPVAQVACGDHHTIVLTSGGDVYCFGHRDAVGGHSHSERCPERFAALGGASGQPVDRIFAGGTGSFALVKEQGGECKSPLFQSWGYNQRFQLGRYTAELELHRPGPAALPRFSSTQVRAFSAGASHCLAVLDAPGCSVLPADGPAGEPPFFGTGPLLAALRGDAPYDVSVASGTPGVLLGAHRCILRARCAPLALRLRQAADGAGAGRAWALDLAAYGAPCVRALLEYLYTDFCRAGTDVAAELRPLAKELELGRLGEGIATATESTSLGAGLRWVRTGGRWEQVESQEGNGGAGPATASSYVGDLEGLVTEEEPPEDLDYVRLVVRGADGGGPPRVVHAARPVLLTIDFFRAWLEGGFAEAQCFSNGLQVAELSVDDADAFVLCLRMVVSGNHGLLPSSADEIWAIVVEAHRLQLVDVVSAAEAALCHVIEEGTVDATMHEFLAAAADLYSLPKIRNAISNIAGAAAEQSAA